MDALTYDDDERIVHLPTDHLGQLNLYIVF